MKHVNILVFPCGSEVGLEINKSLKDISFITLFGGSSVRDHGEWEYENYIGDIPFITDENFIDELNAVIDRNHIDFIFPALDAVVLRLSECREELHAEVLTSSREAVRICRSKEKTYEKLKDAYFLPEVYASPSKVTEYPVLMKPAVGQGGQGVRLIPDEETLRFEWMHQREEQVLCEYLPGTEYTVDCFTDRNGVLKYCAHRSRRRIKSGISVCSVLEPESVEIQGIAEEINRCLSFRGAWFFQVKRSKSNEFRLMEVATRVAGTMCVSRARGVNLPLLTVFDAMGYDVEIQPEFNRVETDRALSNCYRIDLDFDELYIDYDDTIVIHDRVHLPAMALLYKCVNRNIPVYLVTKHGKDIYQSLRDRHICETLFRDIITVEKDADKADYIQPGPRALYIDDSFAERKRIRERFGIKVMGVDSLEVLLNGVKM